MKESVRNFMKSFLPKQRKISPKIFYTVIFLLPIVGVLTSIIFTSEFEAAKEIWQHRIESFGVAGPVVFVLMIIMQVVLAPIGHYTLGMVGGFLYGQYTGMLLNYIGFVLGALTAFFISRYFGRPIAEKFVDSETINKYDHIVSGEMNGKKIQPVILFLVYILPVVPQDEITYLVGLSKMKFRYVFLGDYFRTDFRKLCISVTWQWSRFGISPYMDFELWYFFGVRINMVFVKKIKKILRRRDNLSLIKTKYFK